MHPLTGADDSEVIDLLLNSEEEHILQDLLLLLLSFHPEQHQVMLPQSQQCTAWKRGRLMSTNSYMYAERKQVTLQAVDKKSDAVRNEQISSRVPDIACFSMALWSTPISDGCCSCTHSNTSSTDHDDTRFDCSITLQPYQQHLQREHSFSRMLTAGVLARYYIQSMSQ